MIVKFIGGPFDGHSEKKTFIPDEVIPKQTSARLHHYVVGSVSWDSDIKRQVARFYHESLCKKWKVKPEGT